MSRTLVGASSVLISGVLAASGVAVLAQEGTPEPGAGPEPYGAALRAGTCQEPGDVVAVLADPATRFASDDPGSGVVELGPTPAQPVRVSESEVPLAIADIAEGGHSVVVGDPAGMTVVACGVVGGPALDDERLAIALSDQDGDPIGMALLGALGVEATNVLILLALPGERSDEPQETPAASPSPDADGFVEPDPDEPGPDPDPDVDPGEDIDEDVSP